MVSTLLYLLPFASALATGVVISIRHICRTIRHRDDLAFARDIHARDGIKGLKAAEPFIDPGTTDASDQTPMVETIQRALPRRRSRGKPPPN